MDIRFELAPMLDVVFILLIFFIFAMVLSKRFTVTDIRLPASGAGAGAPTAQGAALIISLHAAGGITLNDQPVELESLVERLAAAQREKPEAKVYLAPDEAAPSGSLFVLMDTLAKAGIRDMRFLRRSGAAPKPP